MLKHKNTVGWKYRTRLFLLWTAKLQQFNFISTIQKDPMSLNMQQIILIGSWQLPRGLLTWLNQDDQMNLTEPWQQRTLKIKFDQNWNQQTYWTNVL